MPHQHLLIRVCVLWLQKMLLMRRDSKNSRLGPQSVAGSYVSNRSEGQKSLASLASMMSDKVPTTYPSASRKRIMTIARQQ